MAQLIQRVASWLAQEVAVPLLAKSKPFQAAARASVQGVEKVKDISNTAAEAAAEAAAKSKEAVAQAKRQATAAAVDGEVVEEGPGLFKSISEAIKKVRACCSCCCRRLRHRCVRAVACTPVVSIVHCGDPLYLTCCSFVCVLFARPWCAPHRISTATARQRSNLLRKLLKKTSESVWNSISKSSRSSTTPETRQKEEPFRLGRCRFVGSMLRSVTVSNHTSP